MNFGMEIEEEREEEEKNGRSMEESCLVKGRREKPGGGKARPERERGR